MVFNQRNSPGGLLAIATVSGESRGSKWLRVDTARAIAAGLDSARALRSITADAARILNLHDRIGTLKVGHEADLAVTSGDPLNPASRAVLTIVAGHIVHDARHDQPPAAVEIPFTEVAGLPSTFPEAYVLSCQRVLFPDGGLQSAHLEIRGGIIRAVHAELPDSDLPVFDAGDAVLTPGLVIRAALSLARQFGLQRTLVDPGSSAVLTNRQDDERALNRSIARRP